MKNIFIIILCLSSILLNAQAEEISKTLKSAETALSNLDLNKAVRQYKNELSENPENIRAKEGLIKALMLKGGDSKEELYENMGSLFNSGNMSPAMKLGYANMLSSENRYDEAARIYTNISNSTPSGSKLFSNVSSKYFNDIEEPNTMIKIRNISEINTEHSDFSPMLYKGDRLLYVSTKKNRENTGWAIEEGVKNQYTDLFQVNRVKEDLDIFENPTIFLKINNQKYMQGPVSFANNYGVMYMTRSILENDKKVVRSSDDNKTVNLEIYRVQNAGDDKLDDWVEAIPVVLNPSEDYANYSYAHPALSSDGKEMIFSSNMPGGYGGTDLWKVTLNGSQWSTPVNLGPSINTGGNEMFPYLTKNNKLYFASNGLPGLGGLDIFEIDLSDNSAIPQNMGAPLNSKMDDFGFIIDEDRESGFFTSNRLVNGENVEDDIYTWRSTSDKIVLKVVSALDGELLTMSDVNVPCLENQNLNTGESGLTTIEVKNYEDCQIRAYHDGYEERFVNLKNFRGKKVIEIPLNKEYECKMKFIAYTKDKETGALIPNADVIVRRLSDQAQISGKTNDEANLKVNGVSCADRYEVCASKTVSADVRYLKQCKIINTVGRDPKLPLDIYLNLTRAEVGQTFKIENIYYDLDKSFIRADAAIELNHIVDIMFRNPSMSIEMGSHTDCRASYSYNENLSSRRAKSAMEYIISKGIDRNRMTSRGYGESMLTNGCACEGRVKSQCSEEEHQANRRTEFKIISF